MKLQLAFLFALISIFSYGQDHSFPFGQVTYKELELTTFDKDTSAAVVILQEFGEGYIDNDNDHNLIFEYHIKCKILKKKGLDEGTVEIPLYKGPTSSEKLKTVKASTFNIENGKIQESTFSHRDILSENLNKYWDVKKMALPNVKVGSVIDLQYTLESPFIYNFRPWLFQGEYPKIRSEYMAIIPANYIYNISLKGFLTLLKNDSKVLKDYFTPGGQKADAMQYMWSMENIPAFVEEDYMTAKSNFLSAINFELSEVRYFDGRKDRYTKEWKDAETELRTEERFGLQIKRGKDIVDDHVALIGLTESDPLIKAQKIFDFIRNWYKWNEGYGKYSELGIKKAFASKTGNVGDINLSLISALKYADFDVEPMILSTRDNGLPIEIHPVLSDFNYVIAKLNLNDKVYLLDATDKFLPFGLIPRRCLNGKGRVFGEKESYWYDLKVLERAKQITIGNLKIQEDGLITGTLSNTYFGYEAVDKRKKIYAFNTFEDYINEKNAKLNGIAIKKFSIDNADDLRKPLVENWDVEIESEGAGKSTLILNPFFADRWEKNPFQSQQRFYPVDFGHPIEEIFVLNMELPSGFEVVDLPKKVALALPNNGGRYIYEMQVTNGRLTLNSSLLIGRSIFSSEEYHYLKELFNNVVSTQSTSIIIQKKSSP